MVMITALPYRPSKSSSHQRSKPVAEKKAGHSGLRDMNGPPVKLDAALEAEVSRLQSLASGLPTRFFVREIPGRKVAIQVLQGEAHIQRIKTADQAEKLREEFPTIMTEGVGNPTDSWIDKGILKLAFPYFLTLRLVPKIFSCFTRTSGIREVEERARSGKCEDIPLEANHKWKLFERLFIISFGLTCWSVVCNLGSGALHLTKIFPAVVEKLSQVAEWLKIGSSYALRATFFILAGRSWMNKEPRVHIPFTFRRLLSIPFDPLTIGRDETMAKTIDSFWKKPKGRIKALAIMGSGHLEGVSAWLQSFGWQEVPKKEENS
jgi:hypothetical protein